MKTNVSRLLAKLQRLEDMGYGDAEVRIAYQPNWPLQTHFGDVVLPGESDDEEEGVAESDEVVIYLTTGESVYPSAYAPGYVFSEDAETVF
jgi:hypothetical protein